MPPKPLLSLTAAIEAAAGVPLLVWPAFPVALLLGVPLDTPAGVVVGRVAGAALLTLAITCWLARSDAQSPAARSIIAGMGFYNAAVVGVLLYANLALGLFTVLLYPAAILHVILTMCCAASLMKSSRPARP